jgi:Raf kinase inhibitor-like YbhB/YbcL family protein
MIEYSSKGAPTMNRSNYLLTGLLTLTLVAACSDDSGTSPADASQKAEASLPDAAVDSAPLPFSLSSTAFKEGETVPLRYECGGVLQGPGDNVSPQLSWTAGPAQTMSYALVMKDITTGITHWVIYDIPATTTEIAENVPSGFQPAFPAGAKQAEIQGSGYFGYFGPCSPAAAVNTYRWTLHALPTPTLAGVTQASTEVQAAAAIEAASIASAALSGKS